MSQIASAYALTEEQLSRLSALIGEENGKGVGDLRRPHEITPVYGYSGSVMAILIPFLEEHDIVFPKHASYENLGENDIVSPEAAPAIAAAIEELDLQTDDDELASFFFEFSGEEFDEAAPAMREGLSFLARGLRVAAKKQAYFVLNIG